MKKTILKTLFALLFILANQNVDAQKSNNKINITPQLDLAPGVSGLDVTTYPNSTAYPGHYELEMHVTANVNTFQIGTFTLTAQRRQVGTSTWVTFGPTINPFPPGSGDTYSGIARTYQPEDTEYQYRARIVFNSATDGTKVVYTPVRTAKILGLPTPCFSMYNVNSTQKEGSKYGPQTVNTICQYAVAIDGSCSKFEEGYHIRIAEFNLSTWTFGTDYYSGWVDYTGEAPTYTSLNALAASNGYTFTPGQLYVVGFSIGPVWKSAPVQFFRVTSCRESGENNIELVEEVLPIEPEVIYEEVLNPMRLKLYPNPTENYFKVSMNDLDIEEGALISVINSKGVEMYKGTVETNNFEVNTSEWRTGLYFCKIQIGDRIETKKIIKK